MATFKIEAKNLRKLAKQIERRVEPAERALNQTVSDMKSRVPGYVADEVTKVYNIKKSEVMPAKIKKGGKWSKPAGRGKITIMGKTLTGLIIKYEGELITPTHFNIDRKSVV